MLTIHLHTLKNHIQHFNNIYTLYQSDNKYLNVIAKASCFWQKTSRTNALKARIPNFIDLEEDRDACKPTITFI